MRRFFLVLLVVVAWPVTAGAMRQFIDFDFVIEQLREQGTWKEVGEGIYGFQPTDADHIPCRTGRWIYSDFGWTWVGEGPGEWAVNHYGHWRLQQGRWTWIPDIHWLPSTVEWLQSGDHIGWRSSHLDRFSNMMEPESARYRDPREWHFIPVEKIRGPLTPADFADDVKAAELLVNAQPIDHVYVTHREIPRPGPSPDILTGRTQVLPTIPVIKDKRLPDQEIDNPVPMEHFLFRPRFHQDEDGIMRRVQIFLNPQGADDTETRKVRELVGTDDESLKKQSEEERVYQERLRKALEKEREHTRWFYE